MAMTDTPRTHGSGPATRTTSGAGSSRPPWRPTRRLRPARIGSGWGESAIGVYRRELRDGRDVLGEVPDHPIDTSVGVIRVDDLDGNPIAIVFRYSAHPVTVGSRSQVASSDYPGPAREVLERQPRRARPLPPGLRRQHQPPRRHRLRGRLPRHEEPRRPRARRRGTQGRSPHPHQHPGRRTAAARQRPQHPLHPLGAGRRAPHLHAPRRRRDHRRPRLRRAPVARARARDPRALGTDARGAGARRRARLGDPRRPEVRALGAEAGRGRRVRASDPRAPTCRPSASTTS